MNRFRFPKCSSKNIGYNLRGSGFFQGHLTHITGVPQVTNFLPTTQKEKKGLNRRFGVTLLPRLDASRFPALMDLVEIDARLNA